MLSIKMTLNFLSGILHSGLPTNNPRAFLITLFVVISFTPRPTTDLGTNPFRLPNPTVTLFLYNPIHVTGQFPYSTLHVTTAFH